MKLIRVLHWQDPQQGKFHLAYIDMNVIGVNLLHVATTSIINK